ncbi:MAG TPA: type VI secretion system tip protein TssI/VgrG, partial [Polyangiaceae bacterium]|nr:type VI secretion system tip protein TssI/VgrG [Polyangiaceae bacterium]
EGIYYFVAHSAGSHLVVLCDSIVGHDSVPGYQTIPYFPPEEQRRDRDHIDHWHLARRIKPGAVAATDFDFMRPRADLTARRDEPEEDVGRHFEEFDYPGPYLDMAGADKEVRVRIEALHVEREVVEGSGDAAGLAAGAVFSLTNFPRRDQNKQYLIVRAHYRIEVNSDESGGTPVPAFRCEFSAIDSQRRFRAARVTRKPVVEGLQTAIVVGPAGEELFSDEYGRVKVKFHWDREGNADENSSCWVRVSQAWAGTSFGAIHIPRIGQEVLVDFIDGDPDRPIITGRVYNFDNQPPYPLPQNQTQSGFKSNSTKGASLDNYNELRFEDKLGSEHVYMQAEKDLGVLVKNEEQRTVRANRTSSIGIDDTLSVGQNRTATVGSHDREDVTATQTVMVGLAQAIFVGAARTVTSGTETITTGVRVKNVAGSDTASIGGDSSITVTGNQSVAIGGNQTLTTNGHRKQAVDKDEMLSVVGVRQQTVNKSDHLQVGERLVLSAGQEIVLEVGEATFTMKKNGDVFIQGKNIQVDGSGKVNIKGASDVIVKGSKIANN